MKRIGAVIVFSVLAAFLPAKTVHAASSDSLGRIVTDSLYGGAAGALVGAATLAFVDKAGDHTDNIGQGAAIGVILGAIYGTMKVSGPLAEVKDGKMTVKIPVIQIAPDASRKGALIFNLDLVRFSF